MADEGNPYETAFENLHDYEGDLKEAFTKVAEDRDNIGVEDIPNLFNYITDIFSFDCEDAIQYFSWENKEVSENYDLNEIDFNQFYILFRMWLRKESDVYQQRKQEQLQPITARSNKNDLKNQLEISFDLSRDQMTASSTPNFESSQALIKELVTTNQKQYQNLYNNQLWFGLTKVSVEECYIFLQNCFKSTGIEVREKIIGAKGSYKALESSQRFLDAARKYFVEEKEADIEKYNENAPILDFNECFELLEYWLKNDTNIVMLDNRRKRREGGVTSALMETIEKYEKMCQEMTNETEKKILETTIETLRTQLAELERGSRSKSVKDGMDPQKREERKFKALKEIFDVYCMQQINLGKFGTFDKYSRLTNTITLGTFKVLLKNFRLKISHMKLLELFNKSERNDENITFEEFLEFLPKVALRVDIVTETKVHQPNPDIRKEYTPGCYKQDSSYKIFKQNEAKKKQVFVVTKKQERKAAFEDHLKRDTEKLEEIWEHMGLYDGHYKSWIAILRLPFHTHEKDNFRMPVESKYKFKGQVAEDKSTNDVLEELQRRNEMRRLVKDLRSVEKSFMSNYKATPTVSVRTELSISRQSKEDSYVSQQRNRTKQSMPNINRLTLKTIGACQDEDVMKIDEKFNPHDLIEENDEEDDVYLAEYNMQPKKAKAQGVDRKQLEQYGRLKRVSKGFAVNGKYGRTAKSIESPRKNNLEQGETYMNNYNPGYPEPKNITSTKGSSLNSIAVGPSSVKHSKGTASISRSSYLDYTSNMTTKPRVTGSHLLSPNEISHSYAVDYNSNSYDQAPNLPLVSPNGYVLPKIRAQNTTMNRVDKVARDAYQREQQMMDNVISIQDQQIRKGLKSMRK